MDWKAVIAELQALGVTQVQMADACGCRQSTISELARGSTRDPRHSTGTRLLALLEERRAAPAAHVVVAAQPEGRAAAPAGVAGSV